MKLEECTRYTEVAALIPVAEGGKKRFEGVIMNTTRDGVRVRFVRPDNSELDYLLAPSELIALDSVHDRLLRVALEAGLSWDEVKDMTVSEFAAKKRP